MQGSFFEKSYAKLNLFLKIVNKRKDGFHNIRSGITLINLYDEILVKSDSSFNLEYTGEFAPMNKKFDDCIIEKLFEHLNLIKPNYKFIIKKNIPIKSGLGSASSNVAAVLRILQKLKLYKNNEKNNLSSLGADIPLFINNQDCLVRGLGDKIAKKSYPKYFFLLVKPKIGHSTKYMYNKVRQKHIDYKKENDLNEINEFDVGNDFEKIVFKENKQLINIFNFLNDLEGVIFSRLTGSGSCLYATFDNKNTATKAKITFHNKYPELWSFIAENNSSN
tara:strand:+ start:5332 stop:6162 length:831 start_codon:yes stop_codon:yes gene_type:complete